MKNIVSAALIGAAAFAMPGIASAQDAAGSGFIGASAGYHDLGIDDADVGADVNTSSPIVGAYAGYDFMTGTSLFVGVEGNYHFGTEALKSDYGVSTRIGFTGQGGSKFYARGGYQWFTLDYENVVGVEDPAGEFFGDIEDTFDDYLVGVGADFPVGASTGVRVNLDTVSFDTIRATAGVQYNF